MPTRFSHMSVIKGKIIFVLNNRRINYSNTSSGYDEWSPRFKPRALMRNFFYNFNHETCGLGGWVAFLRKLAIV